MFFRGGLLIEPWKAYHYYTSNPKEQSIVSFEDALYVCNTAHQSGATFEENMTLFTNVGSGALGGVGWVYLGDLDLTPPYSLSPDAKDGDVFRCSVAGNFAGLPMEVGDLGTIIFDGASCLITPCYTVIGTMINDAITASVLVDGEVDLAITNKITAGVQTDGDIDVAITNKIADNREKQTQVINLTPADSGNTYYLSADDGNGGRIIYPSTRITVGPPYINQITIVVDGPSANSIYKEGDVFSIYVDTSTYSSHLGTLSLIGLEGFNPIHIAVPPGIEVYISFAVVKTNGVDTVVFLGSNIDLNNIPPVAVTLTQIVNAVDNTTTQLNSNEVSILINDSTDRTQLTFSVSDLLFIGDTPVRITVETNANITSLQFDYSGQFFNIAPLVQSVLANQKMIFVFQRRGDFIELMSKVVIA